MHTLLRGIIAYILFASQCFAAVTEFTQFYQWNGSAYVLSSNAPFVWDGSAYVEIGSSAPITQLSDTFTGANGTLLENHTSDSGHTWTRVSATTASLKIESGEVVGAVQGTVVYYSSWTPTSNDYAITGVMSVKNNSAVNPVISIGVRYQVATGYGYFARINADIEEVQLYKIGATTSLLGSYPIPSLSYTDYTLSLQVMGDLLSVYIDNTLVIGPIQDSSYQSGTVFLRSYSNNVSAPASVSLKEITTNYL